MAKDLKVRIERLEIMRAAHIHVLSETPEEDAWKKMEAWLSGCLKRGLVYSAGTHIRLTHGYEFFLTVGRNIEPDGDIDMRQIPGGII